MYPYSVDTLYLICLQHNLSTFYYVKNMTVLKNEKYVYYRYLNSIRIIMSHTVNLRKLLGNGRIGNLTYTYTKMDGKWVTMCKFVVEKIEYCDVCINSNFNESVEGASKRASIKAGLSLETAAKKNSEPHKRSLEKKHRCTHPEGKCRCLSFYNLRKDVDLSLVVDLCERFGPVVYANHFCWDSEEKRYIEVVMDDYRDASDVIRGCDGAIIRGKKIEIMHGHKDEKEQAPDERDPYNYCDNFKLPPRKVEKKKMTKDELDAELSEYMCGRGDKDKLNSELSEYMQRRKGEGNLPPNCLNCNRVMTSCCCPDL